MIPQPDISVAIPFYNEEENVPALFEELVPVLEDMHHSWEVVCVNDGSLDGTDVELARAAARWPGVRHLRFEQNTGQTAAFQAAFRAARGKLVVTMDGDLQIDPQDLPKMVSLLEEQGVDFVYGWRKNRRDTFLKRVSTRVANGVRNWLTNENINDTGCPLKVFRYEVIEQMPLFNGMHRFFVTLAHMAGFSSAEMIVKHRPRINGTSKYGVWNRIFRALRDCLVVRWMQHRWLSYDVKEFGTMATAVEERPSRTEVDSS